MRSKKAIILMLVMLMLMGTLLTGFRANEAMLEEPAATNAAAGILMDSIREENGAKGTTSAGTTVVVGNTTKVNGAFFTNVYGNNTSDMDVRAMVHGYNPVVWATQLEFVVDPQVVADLQTETTKDGKVFTVKLAKDLTWNDGTPIKAADYVFSYLLQASPELAGTGADTSSWEHILGYEAYAKGKTDALSGIHLVDEDTFSVTVKKEFVPYFYELSYLSTSPYPMSVIAPGCTVVDSKNGAMIVDAGTEVQTIFTTELLEATVMNGYLSNPKLSCGPYMLKDYDAASGTVSFVVNPHYKGNYEGQKPAFENVTLKLVHQSDMADAFAKGEVTILNKVVNAENVEALMNQANANSGRYVSYNRMGYAFLAVATEQGAQQSARVRQALACAIDVNAMVKDYLGGSGTPVYGYYGMGQWQYQATNGTFRPEGVSAAIWDTLKLNKMDTYDFDLNRAEKLLKEDGWTLNAIGEKYNKDKDTLRYKRIHGKLTPLSFNFVVTKDNAAAMYVAGMLQDNLAKIGGELKVTEAEFNVIMQDYEKADGEKMYDLAFLANNFVSTMDPYADFATADYQLKSIAKKMHNAKEGDYIGYMRSWIRYQERFNAVLPTIPLYSNVYYDFIAAGIDGYPIGSNANWPTALLYAEPAK